MGSSVLLPGARSCFKRAVPDFRRVCKLSARLCSLVREAMGSGLRLNVTGTTFQFVPYRGDAPAVQDMMAGQIDMMIEPSSNFTAQVQAGTIRAIAVPAKTRLFSLPEVPTTDEAGLPGYYASIWFGLWAPKNTPKDIVAKLNVAAVTALADENVKVRLNKLGQQIATRDLQDPAAFAAFQKSEADKWWPIIKAANLKVE